MKIIFLDFDGPLISYRSILANGGIPMSTNEPDIKFFDETAIKLIKSIANHTNAKIIVSSTWRDSPCYENMADNLDLPISGRLPLYDGKLTRGEEIRRWLNDNPRVTQYAIVDDDKDFYDYQLPHLVNTPESNGFTWACAVKLAILMGVHIWDVNRPD